MLRQSDHVYLNNHNNHGSAAVVNDRSTYDKCTCGRYYIYVLDNKFLHALGF